MAGINLLKQLKADDIPVEVDTASAASSSFNFDDLKSSEKIKLALIVGGFFAFHFGTEWFTGTYLPGELKTPQAELTSIQQKISATQGKLNELRELEKFIEEHNREIQELKARIRALEEIKQGQRDRAVRMVDFIVNQMPEPVWITSLQVGSNPGEQVVLQGFSRNYQNISTFFTKLETGVYFGGWELVSTQRADYDVDTETKIRASQFELRASAVEVPR